MSQTMDLPYATISAASLAEWLERQLGTWWSVDGDPLLTSVVDFPCPAEELAAELRKASQNVHVFDPRDDPQADGRPISADGLEAFCRTDNESNSRTFLLSWDSSTIQWLMSEDKDAASDAA